MKTFPKLQKGGSLGTILHGPHRQKGVSTEKRPPKKNLEERWGGWPGEEEERLSLKRRAYRTNAISKKFRKPAKSPQKTNPPGSKRGEKGKNLDTAKGKWIDGEKRNGRLHGSLKKRD